MSWFENQMRSKSLHEVFVEEDFVESILEEICRWMESREVSRSDLAVRLGVTRSSVTQMLSGRNLSVRTVAKVARALEATPYFQFRERPRPIEYQPEWNTSYTDITYTQPLTEKSRNDAVA
jgi:transcriptional regulator with XRE-family HTH domain